MANLLAAKHNVFWHDYTVIMAAGTYNTQRLLHRMKDEGRLPRLSPTLGRLTRTNSEELLGAVCTTSSTDFTEGVAISSSFFPQPDTDVEPVRYGRGSNSMGLLQSLLTTPRSGTPRWRTWAAATAAALKGHEAQWAGPDQWFVLAEGRGELLQPEQVARRAQLGELVDALGRQIAVDRRLQSGATGGGGDHHG